MSERVLYKYLDAKGGLMMLYYSNLMFTNATQLNDPFDCHPSLIDYSDAPPEVAGLWGKEIIEKTEYSHAQNYREDTWVCSLSKVYNSLLMWTFYSKNHQGICIGINMEKAKKYLDRIMGFFIGCPEIEVQYKDIAEKPDYYKDKLDFFKYQLGTKAKEWEYEQEVRLFTFKPSPMHMKLLPNQIDKEELDGKEIHVFAELGGECFESVYLGINMDEKEKEKIIKAAKETNPNINIYQMTTDSKAFKLKEELIK